ncbi:MAG: hypothetical protein WBD47_05250 [Phormidesmis sp.]
MQPHSDAQAASSSIAAQPTSLPPTHHWRRSGAFTGAAAVASAGIVLPLVSESASAYDIAEGSQIGISQRQARPEAATDAATKAANQRQRVTPQVTQTGRGANRASNTAASNTTAASNSGSSAALIDRDADGNWTLSYQAQAQNTGRNIAQNTAQNVQGLVAQLVDETARSQQSCASADCLGQQHIDTKLPVAHRQVQEIQAKIRAFEAQHAQQDMAAYQKVLNSRLSEIDQQQIQLTGNMGQTQRYIDQLRMRLATVGADPNFAQQIISQDTTYQTAWVRLQRSEENLLKEFSQANIDATTLNAIYKDYKHHQQVLQRAAQEALSSYIYTSDTAQLPRFVSQAPAALNTMQELVVSTHEYQVQQLRQSTISSIKQRLQGRKNQLVNNLDEYEALQRELTVAQQLVTEYEEQRVRIDARQSADAQPSAQIGQSDSLDNDSTFELAQLLSQRLEDGSLGKMLLGIVVTAGAIAAVTVRRRQRTIAGRSPILSIQPTPGSTISGSTVSGSTAMPTLTPALKPTLAPRMLMPGQTLPIDLAPVPSSPYGDAIANSNIALFGAEIGDLQIEAMSRELDYALSGIAPDSIAQALADNPTPITTESTFAQEVTARQEIDPVQLPLNDVDIFAEHAVRWVIKDLGLAAATANLNSIEPSSPHPNSLQTNSSSLKPNSAKPSGPNRTQLAGARPNSIIQSRPAAPSRQDYAHAHSAKQGRS